MIDTASNQVTATVPAGSNHLGIVVSPNQGPSAAFTSSAGPPGSATSFDGAASSDSDGSVTTYAWDFGDGSGETGGSATTSHVYAQPGTYTATLTVTDNEGCSARFVYTGQTAYCNGGSAASVQQQVTVAAADTTGPGIGLSGKKKQKADAALEVKVRCDEACTVSAGGRLTAGGGGGKLAVRKFRLGKANVSLGAGQLKTLKLKVPKAARGARSGTAKVTVTATDGAGNQSRATRTIKLTAPTR